MRQALLIIDMQRALIDAAPRPFEADAVVDRINALSARARAAGVPVVFIQHENPQALAHGRDGWQLQPGLRTVAGDHFIRKRTADSFLGTPLAALLADQGVGPVVVAGYASEFCVDTTVRRAAALGHPVTIAADAHTTHDKPHAPASLIRAHHNATLAAISSFGPAIEAVAADRIPFGG
ncbi:isochorismatase family protein [Xylophilus sp. Kf1]|nr:isochorismatase family protein [Xylophilus sp. Kf1]